ncbi:MAG: hypothetical protein AAF228_04155 [Pseudomonadota bacterium]
MSTMASHHQVKKEDLSLLDLAERLQDTNINPQTLLTTDYLNHFSAILMLLEMMPTDPELFAIDILFWKPMGYIEHLEYSGFRESELAIACYGYVNENTRIAFDKTIIQLDEATKLIIENIRTVLESGNLDEIARVCDVGIPQMRELISQSACIINGNEELIDNLTAQCIVQPDPEKTSHQSQIDTLFVK